MMRIAEDSHTVLVNWFESFPDYKARELFLAGESYAGHCVPQLALKILQYNKISDQTFINLKGLTVSTWLKDVPFITLISYMRASMCFQTFDMA